VSDGNPLKDLLGVPDDNADKDTSVGNALRNTLGGREKVGSQRLHVPRQVEENSSVPQNREIWP